MEYKFEKKTSIIGSFKVATYWFAYSFMAMSPIMIRLLVKEYNIKATTWS